MKITASRLTTVLGVLLGLAYLLVLSGRIAEDDSPSVANSSGGGLSAFAELLRRSGFRVRVEDDLRPRFGADQFVVVPLPEAPTQRALDEDGSPSEGDPSLLKRLPAAPGGSLLLGRSSIGRTGSTYQYVNRVTRERHRIRAGTGGATLREFATLDNPVLLFGESRIGSSGSSSGTTSGSGSASGASSAGAIGSAAIGGRRVLIIERGEMASNRYIDGPDNAALLVGLMRAAAEGKEIVFYEGFARGGGLLAALGDWAFAARNQLLLALALLVMTLGSRFGLAPRARRKESGQREQSDALGNLLRRWRGPGIGIDAAIEQSRRRLATARKLPSSAPREQWDKYLSPALIEAIEECEEWTRQRAREREALRAIAKLDALTEAETKSTGGRGSAAAGVYRKP